MIVYEITCLADGRRYIGSTRHSLAKRWKGHYRQAKRSFAPLREAIREHGSEGFAVREIACARTEADLRTLERAVIAQEGTSWPAGFNAGLETDVSRTSAWWERQRATRGMRGTQI